MKKRRVGRTIAKVLLVMLGVLVGINLVSMTVNQILSRNELEGIAPTGQLVQVNGKNMHLRWAGNGEQTIVILPGLGTALPSESFAPLMRELATEYTVVIVEYFGLGHSDQTDAPRTNANVTQEIRAALSAGGFEAPFILMPHSASGATADYFAIRHPEEVTALVLLDTVHTHEHLEPNLPESALQMIRFGQFMGGPRVTSSFALRLEGTTEENGFTQDEIRNIRRFMNHYVNETTMNRSRLYNETIREVAALDFPQEIPVLSIRPTRPNPGSAMTNPENNEAHMRRYGAGSELIVLEGNHNIHMGNQVEIREALTAFLERTPEMITVTTFLNHLVAGDYTAATNMFAPQVALPTPLQMLVAGRYGEMLEFTLLDSMEHEGMHIATASATHGKGTAVHQVVLDADGGVLGIGAIQFDFLPMMPPQGATYTAEPVVIGEGTMWALDGLLTIPQDASAENPVPALILIPGSGANNMDASIFDNRAFFDIADYLSSNGVAVLRYNERAFTHGPLFAQTFGANFTAQEEYIEDALLAAQLLRDDERISQVFVLGHSLGGIVAPRIAEEAGLDGVVLMASSPRPLHLIWYDQSVNMVNDALAAGTLSQANADESLAILATQLQDAQAALALPADQLEGVILFDVFPAIYEQSLVQSLPLPLIARNTERPVLILQGGRDFQTTVADDFQVFLDGTAGMAHVTTHLYATLNHLMMTAYRQTGELVVDVMEYVVPGRVDEQVLRDILAWIGNAA